jgi:hypothetical protein
MVLQESSFKMKDKAQEQLDGESVAEDMEMRWLWTSSFKRCVITSILASFVRPITI